MPDSGLITHTLQTAVIDAEGRLAAAVEGKDFNGRQIADLVEAIRHGGEKLKTHPTKASVDDFLNTIENDQVRDDCRAIAAIMEKATKAKPVMWGPEHHRVRERSLHLPQRP